MSDSDDMPRDAQEAFDRLGEYLKRFADKMEIITEFKGIELEEDLVANLSQLEAGELGLEFYVALGRHYLKKEKYLLVNVVKTHIEYNFNVELRTKNGITKYYEVSEES